MYSLISSILAWWYRMMALQVDRTALALPPRRNLLPDRTPNSIACILLTPIHIPTTLHYIPPLSWWVWGEQLRRSLQAAEESLEQPISSFPHNSPFNTARVQSLYQSLYLSNALYNFSTSDTPALTVCGSSWMTHNMWWTSWLLPTTHRNHDSHLLPQYWFSYEQSSF